MAALPQPVTSPADYAAQVEIIRKIESLGGSAGYESNPDAFVCVTDIQALDPFKPDVWTKSIKELAEHENDPVAQKLKAKLQAEVDLDQSNPKLAQRQRIVKAIKGIESLGGSTGFENFSKRPLKTNVQEPQAVLLSSSTYAWGYVTNALIYTSLELHTDTHSGSGHAWGLAVGVGTLRGSLSYDSYNANNYSFGNVAAGALVVLTSGGRETAQFVGALIGVDAGFGFDGSWSW
ncbi:hypothetical protein L210DRAFT_3651900 [Boletus edulis BED1]|uniref:Uncharacterized protein n=1 Tax=Boletus edulis BED1 TaxID=1328754 RepID=A0AAD4G9E8_BOLED|nr:hypothetical protein L210DRAFT_3651900 [Boletus edulis BED1]